MFKSTHAEYREVLGGVYGLDPGHFPLALANCESVGTHPVSQQEAQLVRWSDGTDVDTSDRYYEVWADWLNNGTCGEEKRGLPRRVLYPINPPGLDVSNTQPKQVGLS